MGKQNGIKSSLKKIKDCKIKLSVEVEAKLVEGRFQEVLKDFQKEARLPGFREGKAPLDLVEKKFSKEAQEEVLKSLIPEVYHQCVLEHKVSPVTLPSISDICLERGKNLTFSAEFEKEPEFSIRNYKGIKIRKIPMEVHDEDVEKGLASLLDSRAELNPLLESRAAQRGDFIAADVEAWQDGQYLPGKKGVLLFVEPNETDDFYEKVVGAKIDEVREVTAPPTADDKAKGIVGRRPFYKIWIRDIKEKRVPVMDDAFAKIFGKDSAEELKEAVRKDIAAYKKSQSYEKMKQELFERLLAMASLTLPEGLVEKQKERLIDQARRQSEKMGMPEVPFETQKAKIGDEAQRKAVEQVKLYFILRRIAGQEKIEVDEELLERKLTAMAEESHRPMEEVRHVFEEDLRESMVETKTIEFLLANAKLEDK